MLQPLHIDAGWSLERHVGESGLESVAESAATMETLSVSPIAYPSQQDQLRHGHSNSFGRPPLTLLKNFPYAADLVQPFRTKWVPVDSEFQFATVHVHCQTLFPATLPSPGVTIGVFTSFDTVEFTSFDTVEFYLIGTSVNVTGTGSQSVPVTTDLGPMVRVEIANGATVPVFATLSVWLQPKST